MCATFSQPPITHTLGLPRIGTGRALKWALEAYWRSSGTSDDRQRLEAEAWSVRDTVRRWQAEAGISRPAAADFSFYDGLADLALLFGQAPARFGNLPASPDSLFALARGRDTDKGTVAPLAMTKWFDTNYHFLVPELDAGRPFRLDAERYLGLVREALDQDALAKPVLVGPMTFLWLARGATADERLDRAPALADAYSSLLSRLVDAGVEWVQIDEPVVGLDLPSEWLAAFEPIYHRLRTPGVRLLLASYFAPIEGRLGLLSRLPVDGLHVDFSTSSSTDVEALIDRLPDFKVISAGVLDGRSIWRADLDSLLERVEPLYRRLGERMWLAPSCSLLHVPLDAAEEQHLPAVLAENLSFARQKLNELSLLSRGLAEGREAIAEEIELARSARWCLERLEGRLCSDKRAQVAELTEMEPARSNAYGERARAQREALDLPLLPTTTIGSFPQTNDIRATRRAWRRGEIDNTEYEHRMHDEVATVIRAQEMLGLDLLVHGEPERNDMVEYFGEQLEGFAFTRGGWVQSYGSRCVKPPIIWGDVGRPQPMTVRWSTYAQSLTDRPVKGMLTGPVTLLSWSFVRDDLSREQVAYQLAASLREEVTDLAQAGIAAIQMDEPAFREGLPLRRSQWGEYLDWAVRSFRLATAVAPDTTQIHTHMCYSEFNDIIESIAALDADVITIETTRSNMKLLDAFADFDYPNEIGPGVWDIHSPLVPSVEEIVERLELALAKVPVDRLWVNPDCGLKTRGWPETRLGLERLVEAARHLRNR
ncbi:5-methyltetrahydropteroyltriglutamate--homocysteine S-methyltransferase [Guyparkeria hydrothermalis]|uniref:5-methyltetrahydropteroyltriglutamate-- homocysteine S-methyltransferase n=1 Tax=Guyparkeria hydrothermalis TaxID=923 RepID=UPI00202012BD|nr:5-methyltetrahydropteroyltriglutamate--homocysteine S-methyltransferase [Guyparkeria hydrothermalis]MCL7744079.1 5-methyltetrahydropteroyltriglutamate--homocysteine S-methyltransferase [Guyparkeria hydrothermalis]